MFALFATFLLLAASVKCIDESSPEYETIVVGLGSAGTTAASTLARAGKRVLAVEAMDRIGGRVSTVPFGEGVVEVGAEWMHGTHPNRIYDLAIQNNITILIQDLDEKLYKSDGSMVDALIYELLHYCFDVMKEVPKQPESTGHLVTRKLMDYLKENNPELLNDKEFLDQILYYLDLYVDTYQGCNSWNDINAATTFVELEGHHLSSWGRKGYRTFFDILLNKYNNGPGLPTLDIKLSTEVTLITWSEDPKQKVQVTTKDGTVYTANNVIVTVSLGVLKERHSTLFSPPLPQAKAAAIDVMGFGLLDKIMLAFPTVWWPRNFAYGFLWTAEDRRKLALEDVWISGIAGASSPMGSDNVLTLWMAGEVAKLIETLPEDVVKRKCMGLIRRFMGSNTTIPDPIGMVRTTWFTNPFTRGSYSYDNMELAQHPTARGDLRAPLTDSAGTPRVLFAGEATDKDHFSVVNGAADSGYREAMRLLSNSSNV